MDVGLRGPGRRAGVHRSSRALGVGLADDVPLELSGAELAGVWSAIPFIEALKSGGSPDVGRRVVIIGGGNTAIDVGHESLRLRAVRRFGRLVLARPARLSDAARDRPQLRELVRLLKEGRNAASGELLTHVLSVVATGEHNRDRHPEPRELA